MVVAEVIRTLSPSPSTGKEDLKSEIRNNFSVFEKYKNQMFEDEVNEKIQQIIEKEGKILKERRSNQNVHYMSLKD